MDLHPLKKGEKRKSEREKSESEGFQSRRSSNAELEQPHAGLFCEIDQDSQPADSRSLSPTTEGR